ncbi:hypothetical protein EYF80_021655 [Liparis tanakae]|uniref:Uncharacterized protein n=1 Tax=Liparis tanakae TaxID=230148 RepID=A0A4Z2HTH9_9TELE|nr:hypothetical protein EYF80_021655 [Liparis tanakae]
MAMRHYIMAGKLNTTISRTWRSLTVEVTLDLEESHAEPQHRQLVQTTPDLPGEGQHAGELPTCPINHSSLKYNYKQQPDSCFGGKNV